MSTTIDTHPAGYNHDDITLTMWELGCDIEEYSKKKRSITYDAGTKQEQVAWKLHENAVDNATKEINATESATWKSAGMSIGLSGLGGLLGPGLKIPGAMYSKKAYGYRMGFGDGFGSLGTMGAPAGQLLAQPSTTEASFSRVESDKFRSLHGTHDRQSGTDEARSHSDSADGLSFGSKMNDLYTRSCST